MCDNFTIGPEIPMSLSFFLGGSGTYISVSELAHDLAAQMDNAFLFQCTDAVN